MTQTPPSALQEAANAAPRSGPGSEPGSAQVDHLRLKANEEAQSLPPLLLQAQQLAGAVALGDHGRRQSGFGDEFWQYRPLRDGDSRRMIDHRRSARGDMQFVRETEWQIAQTLHLWVDRGGSMRFSSDPKRFVSKAERARLLGLAAAILMLRAGERVGLTGGALPPRNGKMQELRLAQMLSADAAVDYAPPEHRALIPQARALFVSDLLGPLDELETALSKAADRGVRGVLLQVLDPAEESFPFEGRTLFEGPAHESASRAAPAGMASLRHETLKASALRDRYLARLAERRAQLQGLCRVAGWQFGVHHTQQSAQAGLLWIYHALSGTGSPSGSPSGTPSGAPSGSTTSGAQP